MTSLRTSFGLAGTLLFLCAGTAQAQYAPTPQKSPRTPVSKEVIAGRAAALRPGSVLEGVAHVLDAERLRIDETEVRLFGIVPPQMAASFGPQARAVVDSLSQGNVSCQIKDRTRDGAYLALCNNNAKADFGLELLRRGLAVTARGSLRSTAYAGPYLAAEQAAQSQRLGLWSTTLPSAASETSIREAMARADQVKNEAEKVKESKEESAKPAAKVEAPTVVAEEAPAAVLKISTGEIVGKATPSELKPEPDKDIAVSPTAEDVQAMLSQPKSIGLPNAENNGNIFERYQILISGLLLFATTLVITTGVVWTKTRQRKEDLRALAAALHGELMAARSVCQARLAKIAAEGSDRNLSWPRIRVMIFQAYIGKLGDLGAELSRQIASIYGMASDYASYYNTTEPRAEGTSKRQALEALVQYIEEVTPRLAQIERTGKLPSNPKPVAFAAALKGPKTPLSLASNNKTPSPPTDDGPGTPTTMPSPPAEKETRGPSSISINMSEAKAEIVAEAVAVKKSEMPLHAQAKAIGKAERSLETSDSAKPTARSIPPNIKVSQQKRPPAKPMASPMTALAASTTSATKAKAQATAPKTQQQSNPTQAIENAGRAALKALSRLRADINLSDMKMPDIGLPSLNLKAPIIERLAKLKAFAATQAPTDTPPAPQTLDDFTIPDYANLTEEELEALLYTDEEILMASPAGKTQRVG